MRAAQLLDAAIPNSAVAVEYESMRIDLRTLVPDLSTTYTLNIVNTYKIRPEFVKSLLNPELLGRQALQITGTVKAQAKPTR